MKTQRDWLNSGCYVYKVHARCVEAWHNRWWQTRGKSMHAFIFTASRKNELVSRLYCHAIRAPPHSRKEFVANHSVEIDPIPDPIEYIRVRVCVCVCVRVSRTCASSIWRNWYWRRSSLERVRNGAEADILSLFLLRQSRAAYNLRTCGYVLRVAARSRHRVEVRYH